MTDSHHGKSTGRSKSKAAGRTSARRTAKGADVTKHSKGAGWATSNIASGKSGCLVEVTHRTLKNEQGRVFRELDSDGAVAVRNRDRVDGILLSPAAFEQLRDVAEEAERLRAALPLLLAAASSGVAIPSETFETLGIPGHEDWRSLNEMLAALPLKIALGEDGEPLPDTSHVKLRHQPVVEFDDDEELIVVDDASDRFVAS